MGRTEVLSDIKATLGIVPGFFEGLPDNVLSQHWDLMKTEILTDTELTVREKALIALGAASALRCEYWVPFHTGLAQLGGASEKQIQETSMVAAMTAHWSVLLNGINYDKARFMKELQQVGEHAKRTKR